VIDFLRGRGPGAGAVGSWLAARRLRLSAVTAFEIRLGSDFERRRPAILRLLGHALPLDPVAALIGGEVLASLRAEGRTIDRADALQSGICIRFDLPLATRNVRHFDRVPGLRLVEV
jgi:tRNA(fMet)-specific endonuclease VapC